jgi:hypothetical protein
MASNTNYMTYALISFACATLLGLVLAMKVSKTQEEGFTTIALDREVIPKCFLRDPEATKLLESLRSSKPHHPEAFAELSLILQKMLCIDADVTSSGAGAYSTFQLPFVTQHDIEPAASFVNRCLKGALRSRDLEIAIEKFERRGATLVQELSQTEAQRANALQMFRNVTKRASRQIAQTCTSLQVNMDTPKGVRDPGYTVPSALKVRPGGSRPTCQNHCAP